MHLLSDYDFFLPKELIAVSPRLIRGSSRLLALRAYDDRPCHDEFKNIGSYLKDGDVLVINNTKVMKARIFAEKASGGKVELLLVRPLENGQWAALVKGYLVGKTLKLDSYEIVIERKIEEEPGLYAISSTVDLSAYAKEKGEMPLPPYFGRKADENDDIYYQTIFAKDETIGAVAAPTAGLHFTEEILSALRQRNIQVVESTLHVGPGTFLPVRTENIEEHKMHSEFFSLSEDAAFTLNLAKKEDRRIVVVGTTAMRVVEQSMQWAHARGEQHFSACAGNTAIFIRPGYKFLAADAIITNFHVPKSSLIMLTAAVVGLKKILSVYEEAVEKAYRFFSYGDACYFEIRKNLNE